MHCQQLSFPCQVSVLVTSTIPIQLFHTPTRTQAAISVFFFHCSLIQLWHCVGVEKRDDGLWELDGDGHVSQLPPDSFESPLKKIARLRVLIHKLLSALRRKDSDSFFFSCKTLSFLKGASIFVLLHQKRRMQVFCFCFCFRSTELSVFFVCLFIEWKCARAFLSFFFPATSTKSLDRTARC